MILPAMKQIVSSINYLCITVLLFLQSMGNAQQSNATSGLKISCPEKWWAVRHTFVAKKALTLTRNSFAVTDSLNRTPSPDRNLRGGQLDAFKHAYWMATLTQKMKWKKAKSLGLAHEKANYRSFIRATEKGITDNHDQASMEMDLWNNEKGIAIGLACRCCANELIQAVMDSIVNGGMKIIRVNLSGQFLDRDGNILPEANYKGKWINDKHLVPSNYTDKE
jgi:hypothetical protein